MLSWVTKPCLCTCSQQEVEYLPCQRRPTAGAAAGVGREILIPDINLRLEVGEMFCLVHTVF